MNDFGMVIIGTGEAGARAAVELRTQGWAGSITMIGEEKQLPYERPPLSKQHLLTDDEPSPVVILDQDSLEKQDIRFISGVSALQIDRVKHRVILSDGNQIGYKRLLLAIGASPRKLNMKGNALDRILYLRTFKDALMIRERLHPGQRIAVIGGGFIGLEVAASAITRGCSVNLIEVGSRILMRGVPEEIARIAEERHRKAGVHFKLGIFMDSIHYVNDEYEISLADGTTIRCDMVIAGIGAVPETALAADCGLEIDNGVKVSEMLVSSDPDIFAAGDCCSFPHPLYAGRRIRLESWRNAQDQGTRVAGNMLGKQQVPYTAVPWFWSDQYEQTLQVTGLPDSGKTTVIRDLGDEGKLFFHLSDTGQLVSASGIGLNSCIAKEIHLAEMLIERQAVPKTTDLSDPAMKLKALLREIM
jgi:3-phenylpropionate/trans-cinnamate dioxygenase ferredoxin reductase subunit